MENLPPIRGRTFNIMPNQNEQTELIPAESEGELMPTNRSEAGALLEVIARAATDESVDVDKMERLLAMQEKVLADESRRQYFEALRGFQADCPQLTRGSVIPGKRTATIGRYCKFEDMMKIVRPVMNRYGFGEQFDTKQNEAGQITAVVCTLSHTGGHSEQSTFPVTPDQSGAKNAIQAIGSALSYGKRYALGSALGLVFTNEDSDGQTRAERLEDEKGELAIESPRESLVSQIERLCSEADPPVEDSELTTAMQRLTKNPRLAEWHHAETHVLVGLSKPAGWEKAFAMVQNIRKAKA